MMGNGFGGGGMVFGFLLMLGLLVLIGLGIWALITWLRRAQSGPAGPADGRSSGAARSQAREVLDERYARGELSTEEYHEKLKALGEER